MTYGLAVRQWADFISIYINSSSFIINFLDLFLSFYWKNYDFSRIIIQTVKPWISVLTSGTDFRNRKTWLSLLRAFLFILNLYPYTYSIQNNQKYCITIPRYRKLTTSLYTRRSSSLQLSHLIALNFSYRRNMSQKHMSVTPIHISRITKENNKT
jgi:hypothetical protein